MKLLRTAGIALTGLGGGIFGAVALVALGVWLTPLKGDPEFPVPGDGVNLLVPVFLGVAVGFPGGALLAISGLRKLIRAKKLNA